MANTGYLERIKVPLNMVQSSSSAALDVSQLDTLTLAPSPTKALPNSPPSPSPSPSPSSCRATNETANPSPARRNHRRACTQTKTGTASTRQAMAVDDASDSEDDFRAMSTDEAESDDAMMEDDLNAQDSPTVATGRKAPRMVNCVRLLKPYVPAHRSLSRTQHSLFSADENAHHVDSFDSQLAAPTVTYGQWPPEPSRSPADTPMYRVAQAHYLFNAGHLVPLPVTPALSIPTVWPEGTLSYGQLDQGVRAFQTLETVLYQAIVASGDAGTPIGPLRTQLWTVAYRSFSKLIDSWVTPKHFKSFQPKPSPRITLGGCTEAVHEIHPTLQITGTFEFFGRMRRKRFQAVCTKASDRVLVEQWRALVRPQRPEPHWLPPTPPAWCAPLPESSPPAGQAPATPRKRMAVTGLDTTPQAKRARPDAAIGPAMVGTPGSQGVNANQRRQTLLRIIDEQEIVLFNRALISGMFSQYFEEAYGSVSTTFDIKTLRRDCEHLERAGKVQLVYSMLPLPVGPNAAVVLLVHPKIAADDPRIPKFVTTLSEQRLFYKGTIRKTPTASVHVQRLSPERLPSTQVGTPGLEESARAATADPRALEEAWMVLAQDLGWVRPKYRRAHLLYEWLTTYVRDPAHVDHECLYPLGVFRMSLLFRAMPLNLFLKLVNQRQLRACNLPVVYNAMVSGDYAALQPSESLNPYTWDDSSLQFLKQDVSPRERNRYRIGVYLLQHQASSIPLADIPPVIHAELFRLTSHIADRFAKLLDIIQALYLVQPVYGDPAEVQQPAVWTQILTLPTNDQGAVTPAPTTVFQLTTQVPMKHHGAPTAEKPVMGLFEVRTPDEIAGFWRQLEISSDPGGMSLDPPGPAATFAKTSLDQAPPVILNSRGEDPLAFIAVRAMWTMPLHFTRAQRQALDQCIDKHTGDTPLVNSVQCTRLAEELDLPESSIIRYYRRVEQAREQRRLRKLQQDHVTTPSRMRLRQYVEARTRKGTLAARRVRHKVVLAEGIPKSRRGRKSIASLQSTLQQRIERTNETDLLPRQQKAAWYRPFRSDADNTEETLPAADLYSTPSSSHGSRLTQGRIRIAWDEASDNRLLVYYAVMRLISRLPNRRFLWLPAIAYLPAMSRRFCDFYCEHHPTVPKRIMEYYVATQTPGLPRAKREAMADQVLQTAVYSFEARNRNTNRIRCRFKRLMSAPSIHDYTQRLSHLWQRLYDFGVEAGDILRYEDSARRHKHDIVKRQDEITPHWVAFWLHYFQTSHSRSTVAFRQLHFDASLNAAIDASDPAPPHDFRLLVRWMLHSDRMDQASSMPYVHDDTWYIDFNLYLDYWEKFQTGALADRLRDHGVALSPLPAPATFVTGAMRPSVDVTVAVEPIGVTSWTLPSSPRAVLNQFTVVPLLLDRYHQVWSDGSMALGNANRPTTSLVHDGVVPKQFYYEEDVQAAPHLIRCNQLLCQQPYTTRLGPMGRLAFEELLVPSDCAKCGASKTFSESDGLVQQHLTRALALRLSNQPHAPVQCKHQVTQVLDRIHHQTLQHLIKMILLTPGKAYDPTVAYNLLHDTDRNLTTDVNTVIDQLLQRGAVMRIKNFNSRRIPGRGYNVSEGFLTLLVAHFLPQFFVKARAFWHRFHSLPMTSDSRAKSPLTAPDHFEEITHFVASGPMAVLLEQLALGQARMTLVPFKDLPNINKEFLRDMYQRETTRHGPIHFYNLYASRRDGPLIGYPVDHITRSASKPLAPKTVQAIRRQILEFVQEAGEFGLTMADLVRAFAQHPLPFHLPSDDILATQVRYLATHDAHGHSQDHVNATAQWDALVSPCLVCVGYQSHRWVTPAYVQHWVACLRPSERSTTASHKPTEATAAIGQTTHVIPRVWKDIHGHYVPHVYDSCLRAVLNVIRNFPGTTRENLVRLVYISLSPAEVDELLDDLMARAVIESRYLGKPRPPTLFSKPQQFSVTAECQLGSDYTPCYWPRLDYVSKFAQTAAGAP
ncbi:hypothetical protein H4R34_003614 [Dimargaris verticillata]|uniref:Transcription factor tau subunit sfc3/Tfc3 C-terminal domain-containing protein n=1 Tax=Dimargaris verticillata TaxID=2761393 RepID=A0A9W8B1T6_9FUNG|nr:hypothetical protein H4R34_003614 [Dimargaris verticillata]